MGAFFKIFAFNGTASRRFALGVVLIYLGVLGLLWQIAQTLPLQARWLWPLLGVIFWAASATTVRRLHAAGYSGRWALVTLVPFLGLAVMFAIAFLPPRRPYLRAHDGLRMTGYAALSLTLIFALTRVWWAPFMVTSESMKPTLLEGDYLTAGLTGPADLARGDVILFHPPGRDAIWVNRVIGLPGDQVQVQGGQVSVNGTRLVQQPLASFTEVMGPKGPSQTRPICANGAVGDGAICTKDIFAEAMDDGRRYMISNIMDGSFGDEFGPVTVPAGKLFLMGDNRDNALDSRFDQGVAGLGLVPMANVIGRAGRVMISAQGISLLAVWTWRPGRILARVR